MGDVSEELGFEPLCLPDFLELGSRLQRHLHPQQQMIRPFGLVVIPLNGQRPQHLQRRLLP